MSNHGSLLHLPSMDRRKDKKERDSLREDNPDRHAPRGRFTDRLFRRDQRNTSSEPTVTESRSRFFGAIGSAFVNRPRSRLGDVQPSSLESASPPFNRVDVQAIGISTERLKKSAEIAWTGFKWIAECMEPFVSGTPFETPLAVVNFLIKTGEAVEDNESDSKTLYMTTLEELKMVNDALIETQATKTKSAANEFAKTLIEEAVKLHVLMDKTVWMRVVTENRDRADIDGAFKAIHHATQRFHSRLLLTIDSNVNDILDSLEGLKRDNWRCADEARFDYDRTHNGCTSGTRVSILEDIQDWASNSSKDSHPIFWLSGPAGSGKSTIAYSIAEYFQEQEPSLLGASFVCARQFPERRDLRLIVPTIVKSLARSSRAFAIALESHKYVDSVRSLKHQLQDLLVRPLTALASLEPPRSKLPPRVIVIDALDELEGTGGSDFLRDFFPAVAPLKGHGFKFLITSREEPDIEKLCETHIRPGAIRRLQSIERTEVTQDIHRYLQITFPSLVESHAAQLWDLAVRSDGLFVFAATAVRYALPPGNRFSEKEQWQQLDSFLTKWPPVPQGVLPLDSLYKTIIDLVFDRVYEDALDNRLRILSTILCVVTPACLEVIAALSGSDLETVSNLVELLHAVIYLKQEETGQLNVTLYHKSFADFLFDGKRSGGRFMLPQQKITETRSHIALKCIDVLQSTLHFHMHPGFLQRFLQLEARIPYAWEILWPEDGEVNLRRGASHWLYEYDAALIPLFRFASFSWQLHADSAFRSLDVAFETADFNIPQGPIRELSLLYGELQDFLGERALYFREICYWFSAESYSATEDLKALLSTLTALERSLKSAHFPNKTSTTQAEDLIVLAKDTKEALHDYVSFVNMGTDANDTQYRWLPMRINVNSPLFQRWNALFRGLPKLTTPDETELALQPPPYIESYSGYYGQRMSLQNQLTLVASWHWQPRKRDNLQEDNEMDQRPWHCWPMKVYNNNIISVDTQFFGKNWYRVHKATWRSEYNNAHGTPDSNTDATVEYRRLYVTDFNFSTRTAKFLGAVSFSFDPDDFGQDTSNLDDYEEGYRRVLYSNAGYSDSERVEIMARVQQSVAHARAIRDRKKAEGVTRF